MECGRSVENKPTSDLLNHSVRGAEEILSLSRAPFLMGIADCPGLCGLTLRVENTVQGSQATMSGFILKAWEEGLGSGRDRFGQTE